MSARDYQHKRFRSRDTSSVPHQAIDSTQPRIVTPTRSPKAITESMLLDELPGTETSIPRKINVESSISSGLDAGTMHSSSISSMDLDTSTSLKKIIQPDVDGPSSPPSPEYVHKPTATNGGFTSASPMKAIEPMRYSLSKGKQQQQPVLEEGRRASDGMMASTGPSNKLKAAHAHALALQRHSSDSKLVSSGGSSKIRKTDPNAYKIFLLLLQPKSKIFELIQLIYSPNDTTVGDILKMIPDNATEQALGSQDYIGLCRPKTQEELLDQELLASEARPGVESALITLGEILVAIPQGFTGPDVAALSKQILANPKIVKLLKRADPLAPKKHRSSRRHHRHSSGQRSSSREAVHVLEKHDEEEEGESREQAELRMQKAIENAAAEAAAANDAIPGTGIVVAGKFSGSNSITSEPSMDLSAQESLADSYTSWSKSFDASFSAQSSICSGVSRRAVRRRDRQQRRMRILQRSAVAAFGVMILFYIMDPRDETMKAEHDHVTETPMGFMGIFQCLFLLLTLYKVERLVHSSNTAGPGGAVYHSEERRCPFLKASAAAMKKLKSRYAKKLQKQGVTGSLTKDGSSYRVKDDDSFALRLRSFSLKAAAAGVVDGNDTDTGSI